MLALNHATEPRCQGRSVRINGEPTLCIECVNCERRTDILAGQTYRWLPPSKLAWCPNRVAKRDPMEGVAI